MTHHVLFLVHGIGEHSPTARYSAPKTDWADGPINSLKSIAKKFDSLKNDELDEIVTFIPITYDHIFHEKASTQKAHLDMFKDAFGDEISVMDDWLAGKTESETNFFWTHISDVLLYRFSQDVRDSVHTHFNKKFIHEVSAAEKKHGKGKVKFHMMSHSLGTAVTNGALTRLARIPHANRTEYMLGHFVALANYFAIANVSRLMWAGNPNSFYNDVGLRPPTSIEAGYVDYFLNVRHIADPVPAPFAFSPRGWQPTFESLAVRHVYGFDVHDWEHYLKNPVVSVRILRRILGRDLIPQEAEDEVCTHFRAVTEKLNNEKAKAVIREVNEVAKNYEACFGDDGDLIPSALRAIFKSMDEMIRLFALLKKAGV